MENFAFCHSPIDITFYHKGQCFFVSQYDSNTITKITLDGIILFSFYFPYYLIYLLIRINYLLYFFLFFVIFTGKADIFAGGKEGYQDGEGSDAMFKHPYGITINQETGDIYVSDYDNHVIRKISPQSNIILYYIIKYIYI